MSKKNREFKFIVNTSPDETTIKEFHRNLAKILINKYGENTMKEVVKYVRTQSKH